MSSVIHSFTYPPVDTFALNDFTLMNTDIKGRKKYLQIKNKHKKEWFYV